MSFTLLEPMDFRNDRNIGEENKEQAQRGICTIILPRHFFLFRTLVALSILISAPLEQEGATAPLPDRGHHVSPPHRSTTGLLVARASR